MRPPRFRASLAALALAAGWAQGAHAAVFRVSPVTLDIPSGASAGLLTLTNASDQPMVLQVRVFRWTQRDGRDALDPTSDVIASPPATTVPPGGQHLVRVIRAANASPNSEEAYRLWIDEIPDPKRQWDGQVKLLLRQSIPVFFGSAARPAPSLDWRVVRVPTGWELAAINRGGRRQRISDLALTDRAGAVLHRRPGLVGYVLSGKEARWPLQPAAGWAGPVALSATSDTGTVRVDLAAPRAP